MRRMAPDVVVLRCAACGWQDQAEGDDVRALLELLAELHNQAADCSDPIR